MIELQTKIGSLYCENPDGREEETRLKIYDSRKRYLDYFTVESILDTYSTIEDFIEDMKKSLAELSSAEKILDYFGIAAWSASVEWTDLLEDMYGNDGFEYSGSKIYDTSDGSEITIETILDNDFVNVIGDTYIFVCE